MGQESREWKVGDYAIKDGKCLVKLDSKTAESRWGVQYVQLTLDGRVIGGGSSAYWDQTCFGPLVSPIDVLCARAFEADLRRRDAIHEAGRREREYSICIEAISAIKAASATS